MGIPSIDLNAFIVFFVQHVIVMDLDLTFEMVSGGTSSVQVHRASKELHRNLGAWRLDEEC